MSSLPYLNRIASRLHRCGLPTDYIHRVVGELGDHYSDLKANAVTDIDTAMGESDELAEQFAMQYRVRTCLARHPIITLILAPIVITQLFLIGYYCSIVSVFIAIYDNVSPAIGLDPYSGTTSVIVTGIGTWFFRLGLVLPVCAAAFVVARMGVFVGRGRRWSYLAVVLQAAIVMSCAAGLRLPCSEADVAVLEVCFPAISTPSGVPAIGMLTRLLFAFAPVMLVVLMVERWYREPCQIESQAQIAE